MFWLVWSRAVVQGVSLVATLIVARLLSPVDYGLMALASIWTSIVALLAEQGLGAAIVQFPHLDEHDLNTCFWLAMGAAGLGYLALYAAAPALGAWFASPILADVLRVTGLTLPLVALRIVPDSLLRKRLELDKVSQAEMAAVVVTVPVTLGMAWAGAGVWALVAGALAMPLVQNLASFWFVRWWPGLRMGSRRLRELLRYSLATLGAKVLWEAYEQADALILGKVSGNVVLGFYSMAKTLAALPVLKVSVVANQLAAPIMAEFQTERSAMRSAFLRVLRLVACLTVPLCAGMSLVADDLIFVALGGKWMPIVPLLRVLCLFWLIRSVDALVPPVLFARYRAAFVCKWNGSVLLVMPFAFWGGAASMGALGIALALILVYPFIAALLVREGLRELEIGWTAIWEELRPIAGAALIMAAGVLLVRWTTPGVDLMDRLVRLALAAGVGALIYGAVILGPSSVLAGEIRDVARWLYAPRTRTASGK